MKLHVIGSSSKGNGYVLIHDNSALIIECGYSLRYLKKQTKIKNSQVVGVLCSHAHGDHSKYLKDYVGAGFKIMTTDDLIASHNIPESQLIDKQAGNFFIKHFFAKHDVCCIAFLILHPDFGKILFATDTCALPRVASDIKLALVEANYYDAILDRNENKGVVHGATARRIRKTHFELSNCISYLKNYSKLKQVVLLHLSSHNSDADFFRIKTQEETGIPVLIAESGKTFNFNF